MGQMRKAEQARLVADLLDYLFTHNREPLWLVLEEADAFAPQQPMGELTRVLGEVDRIARRGRGFGFRLISITQRPAKLNKDVLTQLSTLIAMGVTSPQDRDAIKAWVDGNADRDQARKVYDSLAQLRVGEGWIWAPDHDLLKRVKFPPIRTLDTSKTPKAGDTRITAPVLASADLAKITKQIQAIQATQERQIQTPHQGSRSKTPACSRSAQTGHTSAERNHRRRTLTAWRGDPCRADSGGPVSNRIGRAAQNSTTQHCPARKGRQHPFSQHPATHSQGHRPQAGYHLQKGAVTGLGRGTGEFCCIRTILGYSSRNAERTSSLVCIPAPTETPKISALGKHRRARMTLGPRS